MPVVTNMMLLENDTRPAEGWTRCTQEMGPGGTCTVVTRLYTAYEQNGSFAPITDFAVNMESESFPSGWTFVGCTDGTMSPPTVRFAFTRAANMRWSSIEEMSVQAWDKGSDPPSLPADWELVWPWANGGTEGTYHPAVYGNHNVKSCSKFNVGLAVKGKKTSAGKEAQAAANVIDLSDLKYTNESGKQE
ncbi:hypothetical protein FGW37_05000 [Streptomyces rectiverticillatus]|uniref:hypothetical protein n=1 Tax=Streptomyces rectiverticillatus TaxID=173860 RepID=UPI0015C38959|nr:hypothetical protein [Streptomyces rectiverticillatus]QLE71046.1 hypothetical protein FGW37_05000 [Streptomyces rectiverticillatus]